MGNSPLTIGLKVNTLVTPENECGVVTAGSMLHGRIYLSVQKSGIAAHSIRLKVIGKETVVIHYTTSESQGSEDERRMEDHYERSSYVFFSVDHAIKDFPKGTMQKGQYEFPFSLQLPESLPSTMSAHSGESFCEVEYKVVAEIFQKPNTLLHTNPNATEKIIVRAIPPVNTMQNASLSLPSEIITIHACSCCCCVCSKQGTLLLETEFDRTMLLLDDSPRIEETTMQNATVQFRCENKSPIQFDRVRVELIQVIEWSTHGHTETSRTTLAKVSKDASLYPELNKMWRKPLRWEQHNDDNRALLQTPWRSLRLPLGEIGSKATDTYKSPAIEVRHVVTLTLVSQGCCVTNPDASARVNLFHRSGRASSYRREENAEPSAPFEYELMAPSISIPMVEAEMILPEDWQPEAAELITIPMAEAVVLDGRNL